MVNPKLHGEEFFILLDCLFREELIKYDGSTTEMKQIRAKLVELYAHDEESGKHLPYRKWYMHRSKQRKVACGRT